MNNPPAAQNLCLRSVLPDVFGGCIEDADGNLCPLSDSPVTFDITGPGSFRACANGDPTCIEPFQGPAMHAFNGKLTVIVQSSADEAGKIILRASSPGLKEASLTIRTKYPL